MNTTVIICSVNRPAILHETVLWTLETNGPARFNYIVAL